VIGSPLAAYRVNEARKRAEAKELEARRSEYAADMALAQTFLEKNNRGGATELLEKYGSINSRSIRREETPTSKAENRKPKAEIGRSLVTSAAADLRGWEWHCLATITNLAHSSMSMKTTAPYNARRRAGRDAVLLGAARASSNLRLPLYF
jgi:hypothetical protein